MVKAMEAVASLAKFAKKKLKQNLLSGTARMEHGVSFTKKLKLSSRGQKIIGWYTKKKFVVVKPIMGKNNGEIRKVHTVKHKAYLSNIKNVTKNILSFNNFKLSFLYLIHKSHLK